MEETFKKLRDLMLASAAEMVVTRDEPGHLSLNAPWSDPTKPKQPMWFGSVKLGKAYVSYHLMPIYTEAAVAEAIPEVLRTRQQGKSCFNFRTIDGPMAQALAQVTAVSAKAYATPKKA